MRTRFIAAGAALLVLGTVACAGGGASGDADQWTAAPTGNVIGPMSSTPAELDPERSPLADLVKPGGKLVPPDQAADDAPAPLTLDIPTIRVEGAPVRPVGVLDNGELEIPGGQEVGWYRSSASPERSGSAVLAAHIACNGSDGVFRRLDQLEPGDEITVCYEEGGEWGVVQSRPPEL